MNTLNKQIPWYKSALHKILIMLTMMTASMCLLISMATPLFAHGWLWLCMLLFIPGVFIGEYGKHLMDNDNS